MWNHASLLLRGVIYSLSIWASVDMLLSQNILFHSCENFLGFQYVKFGMVGTPWSVFTNRISGHRNHFSVANVFLVKIIQTIFTSNWIFSQNKFYYQQLQCFLPSMVLIYDLAFKWTLGFSEFKRFAQKHRSRSVIIKHKVKFQ